jgi:FkbM family methyltransferase
MLGTNTKKTLTNSFPLLSLKLRNYLKRGYENEMELLKHFCRKNKSSVDIGANFGLYSYKMLSYSQKVYSFEPIPYLFNNLKKAFKNRNNIELFNIALSDTDHSGTIFSPEFTHGWSTLEAANPMLEALPENESVNKIPVEIRKLDSYGINEVALIKIDVEGHEYNTIKGASNTIAGSKPVLFVEIEEKHKANSVSNVIRLIQSIEDYSVYYYNNNVLHNLKDMIRDNTLSNQINNSYVYNFIFIHNSSEIRTAKPELFSN